MAGVCLQPDFSFSVSVWAACYCGRWFFPSCLFCQATECHNQDKVSMGTIAARDCIRILELTEQVAAATLIYRSSGC